MLHVVHNGFHYGVQECGNEFEKSAIDLHGLFNIAPCTREDFQKIDEGLSEGYTIFIRHLNTRWLTLVPALEKVEES